jgi:hypothetical protein
MANYKKMDDHDFVSINKPLTDQEEKDFSAFLRSMPGLVSSNPGQNINSIS